jgi:hypothetical protein
VLLLPAAFLVRRAPGLVGDDAQRRAAEPQMSVRAALTSPQFAVLGLTDPLISWLSVLGSKRIKRGAWAF